MHEASDISITDTSSIDEDFAGIESPAPEDFPEKDIAEALELHGSQCMVCGDPNDIHCYGIVAQHGDAPGANVSPSAHYLVYFSSTEDPLLQPFYWLWPLGLVDSSLKDIHPTAMMICTSWLLIIFDSISHET